MRFPRPYGVIDLEIVQGSTFATSILLKDFNGNVIDLTDMTARMQGRKKIDDPDPPLFDLTDGNGTSIANNKVQLSMSAAVTGALDFIKGFYDVEITDTLGNIRRILAGRLILSKEVTR